DPMRNGRSRPKTPAMGWWPLTLAAASLARWLTVQSRQSRAPAKRSLRARFSRPLLLQMKVPDFARRHPGPTFVQRARPALQTSRAAAHLGRSYMLQIHGLDSGLLPGSQPGAFTAKRLRNAPIAASFTIRK